MHPLLGYVDRWSAKPGETIRLMVSSAGGAPFSARFARILCGDPNPRGPGYREIAMAHPLAGTHPGREQGTHLGSWVELPVVDLGGGAGGIVVAATIWPTTPARGRQVVFSWRDAAGASLSLELDRDGVVASLAAPGAAHARVATGKLPLERAWYDVWLVVDPAKRRLWVGQRPREAHPARCTPRLLWERGAAASRRSPPRTRRPRRRATTMARSSARRSARARTIRRPSTRSVCLRRAAMSPGRSPAGISRSASPRSMSSTSAPRASLARSRTCRIAR
jgi:hypothetical protein